MKQDGPSLIIEAPPPPGPHLARDVNVCKTYYPLFFLVVHMYPVWWGLHDTLIPLDSTYASPGPPKMKTKIWTNFHQITSIFYILLSFGVILRCLWGLKAYISLWVLLTNVYWFRATGGYICGCGRSTEQSSWGKETLDHMANVFPETEEIRQEYRQTTIYQSFGNDLEQKNKPGQFTNEVLRRLDNCDNSTQPNGQN